MKNPSKREWLKRVKKSGLVLADILPRFDKKSNKKLSNYALKKIKRALKNNNAEKIPADIAGFEKFRVDAPDNFAGAGFRVEGNYAFFPNSQVQVKKVYATEGALSYYSADIFCGQAHVVILPFENLPEYLEAMEKLERAPNYKKFYDFITVREGEFNLHFADSGFEFAAGFSGQTHEELREYLEQYARHGVLAGDDEISGAGKWYGTHFQLVYVKCGKQL